MSAIYAIIPIACADDLNAAFEAMQYGSGTFSQPLTDDPSPTEHSTVTHLATYDAAANPRNFSDYAAAKAGIALPPDINGNPVAWGEDGNISEQDAFAAFAQLQQWANDSTREPWEFAAEQRAGLGLIVRPAPE